MSGEIRWQYHSQGLRTESGAEGLRWLVLAVLIIAAIGLALVATLAGEQTWHAAVLNLATELAGAAATYLLLQQLAGQRARKETLIAQAANDVRGVSIPAVEELRRRGWLTDGSLQGALLAYANLQGAYLSEADLERANLTHADLEGANLWWSRLEEANLQAANLRRVGLGDADLQGADLTGANLEGADLAFTRLQGAVVTAAQLAQAASLEGTVLPDGFRLSTREHVGSWQADFEEWRKNREKAGKR